MRSTPGAKLQSIAADLGISRGALKEWVDRLGSGATTVGLAKAGPAQARSESQAARIVRLEAELAASRYEQRKLETEWDILRQAAKYFAGETNW